MRKKRLPGGGDRVDPTDKTGFSPHTSNKAAISGMMITTWLTPRPYNHIIMARGAGSGNVNRVEKTSGSLRA